MMNSVSLGANVSGENFNFKTELKFFPLIFYLFHTSRVKYKLKIHFKLTISYAN